RLNQCIADLKTIPELREALVISEWTAWTDRPGVRDVDRAARAEVAGRLEKALTEAATRGDVPRRLAVAHLVSALGQDPSAYDPRSWRGFAVSLTPLLVRLCRDREAAVRAAAARALGRVQPDPAVATAALKTILARDEVGPRRAAAEALSDLVGVVPVP